MASFLLLEQVRSEKQGESADVYSGALVGKISPKQHYKFVKFYHYQSAKPPVPTLSPLVEDVLATVL